MRRWNREPRLVCLGCGRIGFLEQEHEYQKGMRDGYSDGGRFSSHTRFSRINSSPSPRPIHGQPRLARGETERTHMNVENLRIVVA